MPNAQFWTDRVWREFHAGNLTRAYRDVLLTLRTFRGAGGFCAPAHATLADRAKCCVRTVQRALQQGQELDLVSWAERRVRAGWRWLRTSNAYRMTTPRDPVKPGMRAAAPRYRLPSTTGQNGRGGENHSRKKAIQQMMQAASGLPDLLAMRRAAFEGGRSRAARI